MHFQAFASILSHNALYFLLCSRTPAVVGDLSCKATPSSSSWPSQALWDGLNASISGQLLAPLPPGAVCDISLPVHNDTACSYIASQYNISAFHAQNPVSLDQVGWELDQCLPYAGYPCNLQHFPKYVVNATQAIHVKAGKDFARK